MHGEVTTRLHELSSTIAAGTRRRDGVLASLARSLQSWITVVRREKAVYHAMNMLSFDVTRQALVAEAWAPMDARVPIQNALQRATVASNATVGTIFQPLVTHEQPPTFFKMTLFTQCFHDIVQAYGVARYREINPTTFSVITFPFLFAVMFGDVGHAFILIAFAALLLWREKAMLKQKLSDIESMIFGGRYVILLMGLFSIFTGFMYNEFFSMPMATFGDTRYQCVGNPENWRECARIPTSTVFEDGLQLPKGSTPYPFGLDPIWHGTKTELTFVNSLKMKMSIVMGVVHMTLGIIMSLFNHLFFRDRLSLLFEFIPQMVFFLSLFGYLAFAIMYKWVNAIGLQDLAHEACVQQMADNPTIFSPKMCTTRTATPDLYGVLINMFLAPGTITPTTQLFAGQGGLQFVLLLLALASIPLMLLPKPLILRQRHQQRALVRSPWLPAFIYASAQMCGLRCDRVPLR
jgi:V-type H+-transporting ATPase subunit a